MQIRTVVAFLCDSGAGYKCHDLLTYLPTPDPDQIRLGGGLRSLSALVCFKSVEFHGHSEFQPEETTRC